MKKIAYIFSRKLAMAAIALLALLPISCSDQFLEIVPEGTTTLEEFLKTPEDVQANLNAAYNSLRSGSFMGGQGQFLSELMADHIDQQSALANGDWAAHYTRTTDIFLGTTRSFMHDGGKTIGRANFVLDNIDKVAGIEEDDKNRIIAECKFLRGIAHFELVRMFGQPYGFTPDNSQLGIPIRTSFGNEVLPRSTVGEVYDAVIQDLKDAAAVLPGENGGYATSWAAKGYLAKIYFQMNDFQNAFDMANDVIQNGPFTFEQDLTLRYSQLGSPENVFSLVSTGLNDNSGGWYRDNYRPNPGNNNIPSITYSISFFNRATADPADKRGTTWYSVVSGARDWYVSNKFTYLTESQVPLIHLTELKLIRAESAAETGVSLNVAAQDLTDIRSRAGLSIVPNGTPAQQLINFARQERELELVSEGNRFHELKRQAVRNDPGLEIRGAIWNCPGLVCQLPDNELQGNPNMIPNDQGGC